MGFHDLHTQQIWPKSGVLKLGKGRDAAPETLGWDTWRERLLVKFGISAEQRHCHIPAVGFHSCRKVHKAEKKLLLPSFSFCWLTAVSGGVPVSVPQGSREQQCWRSPRLQLQRRIQPVVLLWGTLP